MSKKKNFKNVKLPKSNPKNTYNNTTYVVKP